MDSYKEAVETLRKIGEKVEDLRNRENVMEEFKENAQETFLTVFKKLDKYLKFASPDIDKDYCDVLEAQKRLYCFMVQEFGSR